MSDPQITGVMIAVSKLVQGGKLSHSVYEASEFLDRYPYARFRLRAGCGEFVDENQANLWLSRSDGRIAVITVERQTIPFSKGEQKILKFFSAAVQALLTSGHTRALRAASRISSRYAFGHILITRFLRGRKNAPTFWTPSLIVTELQNLTFKRYEGKKCRSGFLFVSNPEEYFSAAQDLEFGFERFNKPAKLVDGFFDKPMSYRYVDGRVSFYAVDNLRNVLGIVRVHNPEGVGHYTRASHAHLHPLLDTDLARVWLGYVGDNGDVNVLLSRDQELRWINSHWHFIDRSLLKQYLLQHDVSLEAAAAIVDVLFYISDLRLGTVLLIPADAENLPPVAGRIDNSPLGQMLYGMIEGKKLSDIIDSGEALGVLTSDGLTTILRDGKVARCGDIVHLGGKATSEGGGRTQAAISASEYGMVLKVSEDGPISLFHQGIEVITLTY